MPGVPASSFGKAKADFVLKLKFVGASEDDSQIRRVRLPRISDSQTGEVSYDELVGLAITFVVPECPRDSSDFQVKLTYRDVDDDNIVIGSSEELEDAIEQHAEQGVLRITAEVKRSTRAPKHPVAGFPLMSHAGSGSGSVASDAGVQAGRQGVFRVAPASTPVLQNVVESVVNIILNAAVAINGRHQGLPSTQTETVSAQEGVCSESASSEEVSKSPIDPEISSEAPLAVVDKEGQLGDEPLLEDEVAVEASTAKGATVPQAAVPAPVVVSDTAPTPTPIVQAGEPTKVAKTELFGEEERSFIHGRHTCDNCLTTPIVGNRYHALNMSDYDLCGNCYSAYKGGGIQFEAVELERDRHLQNRWHRRRERMNARGPGNSSDNGRRRFGSAGHHTRWGLASRRSNPPPVHPPVRGQRGIAGPPGPPPPGFTGNSKAQAKEAEMVELAIRLSLQEKKEKCTLGDIKAEKARLGPEETCGGSLLSSAKSAKSLRGSAATTKELAPVKPAASKVPALGPESSASNHSKSGGGGNALPSTSRCGGGGNALPSTKGMKEVVLKGDCEDREVVTRDSEKSVIAESVRKIETGKQTIDVVPERAAPLQGEAQLADVNAENVLIETIKDEENIASVIEGHNGTETPKDNEVEAPYVASEPFEVQMPSGESFLSEVSPIKSARLAASSARSAASSAKEGNNEPSFSSDAAGNGDVADLLGETLDKCAEAIDAMVSELDRTSTDAGSAVSSYVGVSSEPEEESVVGKDGVEMVKEGTAAMLDDDVAPLEAGVGKDGGTADKGATILENSVSSAERGDEDWQVVSEYQQAGSDEELARAAQMIGSALFNSDMRSSCEVMSTLTGSAEDSDGLSHASSDLTSPPSLSTQVAASQRERWSSQLTQLRSLGIDDDARCVDILERLTAANIGCGSFDEVSVQEVVNELWK